MSSARWRSTSGFPMSSTYRTMSSRRYCPRRSSTAIKPGGSPSARQAPADFGGEAVEEIEIVGTLGGLADRLVDLLRVGADQNAPPVGLDPVENDRRRVGRAGRRFLA